MGRCYGCSVNCCASLGAKPRVFFCQQIKEKDGIIEALEKERDFYFSKLRQVELQCQENDVDGKIATSKVLDLLYATEVFVTHCLYNICMPARMTV